MKKRKNSISADEAEQSSFILSGKNESSYQPGQRSQNKEDEEQSEPVVQKKPKTISTNMKNWMAMNKMEDDIEEMIDPSSSKHSDEENSDDFDPNNPNMGIRHSMGFMKNQRHQKKKKAKKIELAKSKKKPSSGKMDDSGIEAIKEESFDQNSSQQVAKGVVNIDETSKQSQEPHFRQFNDDHQQAEMDQSIDQPKNAMSMEQQRLLPNEQELGATINTNLDDNDADWMVDIGSDMQSGETIKRSEYQSYSERDKYHNYSQRGARRPTEGIKKEQDAETVGKSTVMVKNSAVDGEKGQVELGETPDLGLDFQEDDEEYFEALSYKKLLKVIEQNHPVDPETKEKFSHSERITVADYFQKLSDACCCYALAQQFIKFRKFIKKKIKGEKGEKIEKPESMQDLPDSASSSNSSEEESGRKGLTTTARTLGDGATMYLQSMKTFAIMFFVLTVINMPVYVIYASNTDGNNYSNLNVLFSYFTLGNLGRLNLKCDYGNVEGNMRIESDTTPKKLNLQCDRGYIKDVERFGLLYIQNTKTGEPSTGITQCFSVENPWDEPLKATTEQPPQQNDVVGRRALQIEDEQDDLLTQDTDEATIDEQQDQSLSQDTSDATPESSQSGDDIEDIQTQDNEANLEELLNDNEDIQSDDEVTEEELNLQQESNEELQQQEPQQFYIFYENLYESTALLQVWSNQSIADIQDQISSLQSTDQAETFIFSNNSQVPLENSDIIEQTDIFQNQTIFEKQRIFVKLLNSEQDLVIYVKRSDTLHEVKKLIGHILDETDYDPSQMRLFYEDWKRPDSIQEEDWNDGELLSEETIAYYDLQRDLKIFQKFQIKVICADATTKELDVLPEFTIQEIKQMLVGQGQDLDESELYFDNFSLDDTKTLDFYSITFGKGEQVLYELYEILIVKQDFSDIQLPVSPMQSVGDLKAQILEALEIPLEEQYLTFQGLFLQDEQTLEEIHIAHGQKIQLNSKFIIQFLKVDEKNIFYLPEAASISDLKELIREADLSLPIEELILISGKDSLVLNDDQVIGSANDKLEADIFQMINPNLRCRTECIAQGFVYCTNKEMISYEGEDMTRNGKCCSESTCQSDPNYVCTTALANAPLEFKYLTCPNEVEECGSQSRLMIPNVGTNGIQQHISITPNTETNSFCTFWVKQSKEAEVQDKTWIQFNHVKNARITVYIGTYDFSFDDGDLYYDITEGMGLYATATEAVVVYIQRLEDGPEDENGVVQFETFLQNGELDTKAQDYAGIYLNQNETRFNIDSECSEKTIWKDAKSKKKFYDYMAETCIHKSECAVDPEDGDLNLFYLFNEYCIDRIKYLNITSYDYILVVGCTEDSVTISSMGSSMHKENIGILVVVLDMISVIYMAFIFQKLAEINNEYLGIMDDMRVQMKDFGVQLNNVKVDRYTQDSRLQKMKIWLYIVKILEPHKQEDPDNPLEVIDVSLSIYKSQGMQLVFRMQEIQIEINDIKNNIFAGVYSEEEYTQKSEELKQLMNKLRRLSAKYNQVTAKQEISEVKTQRIPKSQRLEQIQYVYVSFRNCDTNSKVLQILEKEGTLMKIVKKIFCLQPKVALTTEKLMGQPVDVQQLIEPDEIIWENLKYTGQEQTVRRIIMQIIAVVFLLLITILTMYITGVSLLMERFAPNVSCPEVPVTAEEAFLEQYHVTNSNLKSAGLMGCYCMENTSFLHFWILFAHNFKKTQLKLKESGDIPEDNPMDTKNYCFKWHFNQLFKQIVIITVSTSAVIINGIIADLFTYLSKYTKKHTKIEEQSTSFKQIFLMEFTNMSLVYLYLSFDSWDATAKLMAGSIASPDTETDYTSKWYMNYGNSICIFLFTSAFISSASPIGIYSLYAFFRFRDRGYKQQLKLDPEDNDDDMPNSRIKIQQELENLYIGKEFEGEKAYSRMMSTLFVIQMYSSGMPIMYFIGFVFYTITFIVNKILIIKFYKKSRTLTRTIPLATMGFMKYGLLLHMFNACWMLTNSEIFSVMTDSDPATLAEDDPFNEQPKEQLTLSQQIMSRFQLFHQQLYFFSLMGFFIVFIAGESIYRFIMILGLGITNLIKIGAKKLKLQAQNQIQKVAPKQVKTEGSINYEDQIADGFQEDIGDGTERESQSSERRKKVNEQELKDAKDRRDRLRDKRAARQDYSEDMLIELNTLNLSNFFERSKRELDDFRDLFHQANKIGPELIIKQIIEKTDKDGNFIIGQDGKIETYEMYDFADRSDPKVEMFEQFCYLVRVTPDQVIMYQEMLEKRINDIEQVIDNHFKLIRPTLVLEFQDKIEKEKARRQKAGIQMTLEKQFEVQQKEEEAIRNHELQYDDPQLFDHERKMKLLLEHEEDLIKNDKERQDNRRGVQEICRMTGSLSQSYFIFDSNNYKVGRKIYYGLAQDQNQGNDGEKAIEKLFNQQNQDEDDDKSKFGAKTGRASSKSKAPTKRSKAKSSYD